MIVCPECAGKSSVIDSRHFGNSVRRRRKCRKCFHRWSTMEIVVDENGQPVNDEIPLGATILLKEDRADLVTSLARAMEIVG